MISMFSDRMGIEQSMYDKLTKYVTNIQKSSDEMKKIINDVLDLGKIDSGEMKIEKHTMKIREAIMEIYNKNIDIATNKKLNLEYIVCSGVPEIICSDPLRLTQILNNLVSNAIKYSNTGTIILKVSNDNGKVHFSIKDEGIGIRIEDKQKLFKQYSQLDHKVDMTIKQNSTGLGLIISQKLVKLLGGTLEVKSEYGKSSDFYFSLPSSNFKKITSDTTLDLSEQNISPVKGSILLVEDHIENLELLKDMIDNFNSIYGFEISSDTATSGIGAVQACNHKYLEESKCYDLILMDINMEHMDGTQACRIIKKRYGKNKIIALTGNIYAHQENTKNVVNTRYKCFDKVILKPYNDKKILNLLLNNLQPININNEI